MTIEFRRDVLTARFRSSDGSEDVEARVEVRFDPLLGTTSRVASGVTLPKAESEALLALQAPSPNCPFCPPNLERVTPKILPAISDEPRIRVGESILFPNLVPYSQYAAVATFSERHWLSLGDFTSTLLADSIRAAIRYIDAVHRFDLRAQQCAYNVNYLFPSGGSLPHPHAQIYLDPYPTTMLRMQQAAAAAYVSAHGRTFWDDLADAEERDGSRFLRRIGRTAWMTAFAPLGFNEVRSVVSGCATLLDLEDPDIEGLADGIKRVLTWYDASGYNSFNLALYSGALSGDDGFSVNLSMVTRSALVPFYRSDAMYLERLHWEAAVDRTPEENAAALKGEVFS